MTTLRVKKIIIIGTGGNCLDILDAIIEINKTILTYEVIGFLDDNIELQGRELFGYKVLGTLDSASSFDDCFFINGIGSPKNFFKKEEIFHKIGLPHNRYETIIHPSANVSSFAEIGLGCAILANVTICANAQVCNGVIVLPNSVINHDDIIEDFVSIASSVSIAGGVTIKKLSYIGMNTSIISGITVGKKALVGMGSNVINNIDESTVVIGSPAKFLRKVNS